MNKLQKIVLFILLVLAPLFFVVLSSVTVYNESKYKSVTATYSSTSKDVKKIEEKYSGTEDNYYDTYYEYTYYYKYEVNGKEYTYTLKSRIKEPEKEIKILYNPSNPTDTERSSSVVLLIIFIVWLILSLSVYLYTMHLIPKYNEFIDRINIFNKIDSGKAYAILIFSAIIIIMSVIFIKNTYDVIKYNETDLIYVKSDTSYIKNKNNKKLYNHYYYYVVDDNTYDYVIKETEREKDSFKTVRYYKDNPSKSEEGSKVWNVILIGISTVSIYFSITILKDLLNNKGKKKGKR